MNFQVNTREVMTMWNACISVLNAEIPQGADVGLLFETISTLAEAHKKTDKHYLLTMPVEKFKAVWHSLNICISNGFLPNENMTIQALDLMSKLAPAIDKEDNKPKLELV